MDKFADIPRHTTKKTGAYKDYLMHLKDYLVSFMERTRPMYDLDKEFSRVGLMFKYTTLYSVRDGCQ